MLLRLIIENFLSFREITQFDMFPNPKRIVNENHVYKQYPIPILKEAAIYGSNGAGKSNFVKCISFLKEFATDKDFIDNNGIEQYKFALLRESNDKPIEIAVEFINNNVGYIYQISVSSRGVERESLHISSFGQKKNEPVFIRTIDSVTFSASIPEDIANLVNRVIERNPNSSFLSLNQEFPAVSNPDISAAYNWFEDTLIVIQTNSTIPALINLMRNDSRLMTFTREMIKRLCLGINDIEIETEQAEEWISKHSSAISRKALDNLKEEEIIARMENERQALSIFSEEGIKKVGRFLFSQMGPDGHIGKMDISAQSDGTVRLLTLLPAIYGAVSRRNVVVIDEIDYKMHPSLILGIIEYFSRNPHTNGQLIFTTHEIELMDKKLSVQGIGQTTPKDRKPLLRNDEIWFADKVKGNTHLYSLNDFKYHPTMSVRNGYLDGRFKANPSLRELISMAYES